MPNDAAGYWDLARDHFAATRDDRLSLDRPDRPAVSEIPARSRAADAQEGDRDPWWRRLAARNGSTPRVFARLPFGAAQCPGRRRRRARDRPGRAEPTGADRSLLVLEARPGSAGAPLRDARRLRPALHFFAGFESRPDANLDLVEVEALSEPMTAPQEFLTR